MPLTTQTYKVSFVTPAFLGNADQQAQWRTPPFKALLRQWWRLANAARFGFDVGKLAEEEGKLFGAASDDSTGGSRRSRVQIRLSAWTAGGLTNWPEDPKVTHPEVRNPQTGTSMPVGAHLYLGYGPLNYIGGRTSLGVKESHQVTAVKPEEQTNTLFLRFPKGALEAALQLIQWFGTIGGRSRNGWGSLNLEPIGQTPPLQALSREKLQKLSDELSMLSRTNDGFIRTWTDCLKLEWSHAIGMGPDGPLVWRGMTLHGSWSSAMQELAKIKIKLRTALPVPRGSLGDRHVLAYPVTNHNLSHWKEGRVANQIRFKVRRDQDGFRPTVVHIPCGFPIKALCEKGAVISLSADQHRVWRKVHGELDAALQRLT